MYRGHHALRGRFTNRVTDADFQCGSKYVTIDGIASRTGQDYSRGSRNEVP